MGKIMERIIKKILLATVYKRGLKDFLTVIPLCISLVFGCAERPADAPKEFQELTSFLYEHLQDENPDELRDAVEEMYEWLVRNNRSVQRGYTVQKLSREAIRTTGKSSNPSNLIGGAILTAHGHSISQLSRALGVDNILETNGEAYTKYSISFEGDAECFAQGKCQFLEANSKSTSEWVGGLLEVKFDTRLQYRWIQSKYGSIMLHRTFMNKKPILNLDVIDVNEGYYLGIVFPSMTLENLSMDMGETGVEIDGTDGEMDEEMSEETMQDEAGNMLDNEEEMEEEFVAKELAVELDEVLTTSLKPGASSTFLQVNWIDAEYGILPISEDRALEMLVESLATLAASIEKWMNKNY